MQAPLLVWTVPFLLFTACKASCLPEALATPSNITDALGSTAIYITPGDWDSGYIAANIAQILIQEILGLNTQVTKGVPTSMAMYYSVAGCDEPNNWPVDAKCNGQTTSRIHIILELWSNSWMNQINNFAKLWPQSAPILAGDMGYVGSESIFIGMDVLQQAISREGLALEYYKSYNSSWHQPWTYFDRFQDIDTTMLAPCSASYVQFSADFNMKGYVQNTGDYDGIIAGGDGKYVAKCVNDRWWLSPACRGNASRCIALITGGSGWGLDFIMQQVYFADWPVAIGISANYSMYTTIPYVYKVLLYWYTPDNTFLQLQAQPTILPPFAKSEWQRGLKRTASQDNTLVKFYSQSLAATAPVVAQLVKSISFDLSQMNSMLLDLLNSGEPYKNVACRWLKNNQAVWSPWIPDQTSCVQGQGMVSATKDWVFNRSLASTCAWCLPGRYSLPTKDFKGPTYVCTLCNPGVFTALPAATSCERCSPGTYSATTGSTICMQCPSGMYQSEQGQANCTVCPAGFSTAPDSAPTNLSSCVCPAGSFQPCYSTDLGTIRPDCRCPTSMYIDPQRISVGQRCLPCPEGLVCAVGSDEANIPCAAGEAAGGTFPLPQVGYQTLWSSPLSVYRCLKDADCPGGGINACALNMQGVACGTCSPGFFRKDSECVPCDAVSRSNFIFPVLPCLLAPPILVLLHRFSQDPVEKWGSPGNSIQCILYLSLVFIQIIGTIQLCFLVLPKLVVDGSSWSEYSTSLMSLFKPDCAVFSDFRIDFIGRILIPLYPLILFAITYLVSQLTCYKLKRDVVYNIYGSVYYTFFVGIAAQCFSLFQLYKHPNGEWSMRSAPAVLQSSQMWKDLVAVSVTAIVVFCGGALAVFSWAIVQAPKLFKSEVFRARWKFLLIKFRPTTYWWSMVLLAKGVWLALTLVLWSTGQDQTIWLSVGLVSYLAGSFALLPWRSLVASAVDIFMHLVLAVLCVLLLAFVDPNTINTISAARFFVALSAVALIFAALGMTSQLYTLAFPTSVDTYSEQANDLCLVLAELERPEVLRKVLQGLPTADALTLQTAKGLLMSEVFCEFSKEGRVVQRLVSRDKPLMPRAKQNSLDLLPVKSPSASFSRSSSTIAQALSQEFEMEADVAPIGLTSGLDDETEEEPTQSAESEGRVVTFNNVPEVQHLDSLDEKAAAVIGKVSVLQAPQHSPPPSPRFEDV